MDKSLNALRRKLESWELAHLREHCAEQAALIESLQERLRHAEMVADQWQSEAESLREQAQEEGKTVCLHTDGTTSII